MVQKRLTINILIMTVVVIAIFYAGYIPYNHYVSKQIETFNSIGVSKFHAFGYIEPLIVDGFTEAPIENAQVVIPELDEKFITDANGLTGKIRVPIIEDTHFSDIAPKTWGEITIIVYKEGYAEYVLFHTHIWENQSRSGPKIHLFPTGKTENNDPFIIVEGPHRLWVKELIEKYR